VSVFVVFVTSAAVKRGHSLGDFLRSHPALPIWVLGKLLYWVRLISPLVRASRSIANMGAVLVLQAKNCLGEVQTVSPCTICSPDKYIDIRSCCMDVPSLAPRSTTFDFFYCFNTYILSCARMVDGRTVFHDESSTEPWTTSNCSTRKLLSHDQMPEDPVRKSSR